MVLVPDRMSDADSEALGIALRATISGGAKRSVSRSASIERALVREDAEWLRSQAQTASSRVLGAAKRFSKSASQGIVETFKQSSEGHDAGTPSRIDFSSLKAMEMTPASRLLAAVLRSMPAASWSGLPPDGVTVFANDPVGGERPIHLDDRLVASYLDAQTRLAQWADGAGPNRVPPDAAWLLPKSPPRDGGHTILLKARRTTTAPVFQIEVFDREGALESEAAIGSAPYGQAAPVTPEDAPLGLATISPKASREIGRPIPGTVDFDARQIDPFVHEPLDDSVRIALLAYGKAKGYRRVIACVPDDLLALVQGCVKDARLDLDGFRRVLRSADVEEVASGTTLILRPRHPLQEEAARVDRQPLSTEFSRASQGRFDLDVLLDVHRRYAGSYGDPFLAIEQARMRNAFGLSRSPNWSLPHELLAALGDLSVQERTRLTENGGLRLDSADHPVAVQAFADYVENHPPASLSGLPRMDTPGAAPAGTEGRPTALSIQPSRIVAAPEGVWIRGAYGVKTLVKRIAKGMTTIRTIDSGTRRVTERTGENLVIDRDFVSIDSLPALNRGGDTPSAMASLDLRYRFLWSQERRLDATFTSANGLRVGPVSLREKIGESKSPVPLAQVPGL